MPLFISLLLWPLSQIYRLVMAVRAWAYRQQHLPSSSSSLPSIVLGNLSMGGTGKTPHTEYLLRHFEARPLAVLSRGYGRKTKGLLPVERRGRPVDFGDEPLQMARKFPKINFWVGEKRAEAMVAIAKSAKAPQLVLLDDAYQHLAFRADFYLLLTTFQKPFFRDWVLPAGTLREGRQAASRAHAIVVTKCPTLSPEEQAALRQKIAGYSKAPVYFSRLQQSPPKNQGRSLPPGQPVVLLSALAQAQSLADYLAEHYHLVAHQAYRDHHLFSASEIQKARTEAQAHKAVLVVSEKDAVRLPPELQEELWIAAVRVEFLDNQGPLLCAQIERDLGLN